MKTKNIILIALLVLLTGLASCKKDHDIPTGKVFNANDLDANDFEIVGTWGVEKIDYYDIDNAGNPIASTLQSHEYDPNDIDNGIQMVFREDNTGELYDKTSVDSTKVNPFAYAYVNDTLFLEIDYGTDTSTYSCIIVEKTNDSFIYENEYFLNHVEKAYLKRLSHEPIVLSDGFTVSVSANPANGGTVIGGGTYQGGQTCTVTATAQAGYTFVNWTEDGIQVSTSANYTFTVDSNRNLVANFSGFGGGTGKTVLIKDFTGARGVNCPAATEYAYNLQHQLDENHIFIMNVHAGYLAQPIGSFPNFLTDEGTEWYNNHDSNPLFAVDHVALTDGNTLNEGQIDAPVTESLLEEQSFEILVNPQYDETNRQLQVEVQAIALENLDGQFYITACLVEDHIIGWQTTPGGVDKEYDFRNVFRGTLNGAYGEEFGSSHVNSNDNYNFNYNCEINADFNADECYLIVYVYDKSQGDKILQTAIAKIKQSVSSNFTISVSANPSDGGTVTGGGSYQQGQTCMLMATAEAGYTFVNWTENGSQVSEDANFTFTVTGNRTLVANFAFSDYSNIILNELNGDSKFIEIYNKGDMDLSLEGMYIMKDDNVAGATWTADATIVAPAGGYVLLYSADVAIDHPEHPEALIFYSGLSSKKSIRVMLFMPDGTVRDEFTRGTTGEWGQTISNVAPQSYARTPNGGDWKLANPTPGEANPSTGDDIPQE